MMPVEKALNLPLSGREKKDIILQRLAERLDRDCTLNDAICHNGFSFKLTLDIKLHDMISSQTLVWDEGSIGETETAPVEAAHMSEEYVTPNPNQARQDHGLDLPVEGRDSKGRPVVRFKKVAK